MDRTVQKPYGLDSPRCNLLLLFQVLVALANITLNGMGAMLKQKYWSNRVGTIDRQYNKEKVNITVYADDFVVTASRKETLQDIKVMIEAFLKTRGLELSKEKTVITHIDQGFNFLGWSFRKYNND